MIIVFSLISAIATCAIAYYAYENHQLTQKIMSKDKEHKQEISDLYRAIVISALFCAGDSSHTKMESFKKLYNEKNKIF